MVVRARGSFTSRVCVLGNPQPEVYTPVVYPPCYRARLDCDAIEASLAAVFGNNLEILRTLKRATLLHIVGKRVARLTAQAVCVAACSAFTHGFAFESGNLVGALGHRRRRDGCCARLFESPFVCVVESRTFLCRIMP